MTDVTQDQQEEMFTREITDADDLVKLLGKREQKKIARKEAQRAFKTVDDQVKARLSEYNLQAGEVARIGDYKVKIVKSQGRAVSFETAPSERTVIEHLDV